MCIIVSDLQESPEVYTTGALERTKADLTKKYSKIDNDSDLK